MQIYLQYQVVVIPKIMQQHNPTTDFSVVGLCFKFLFIFCHFLAIVNAITHLSKYFAMVSTELFYKTDTQLYGSF